MPTIKYLSLNRLRVQGKFFFAGEEKVFLKGVSYGPFITGTHGAPLPEEPVIEKDFELMQELGVNCLRVYIVPPGWFLELAEFYGLRVLVGIPWSQHITFLDSETLKSEILQTIAHAVQACRHYPAAFAYLVGNEISPDIVRWYGAAKIQAFLQELMAIVKENDPNALVSYANYPCTEYLNLDCVDFLSFNVYLHSDRDFRGYLSRLHNLAVEKPLVFSEFGADSIREGLDTQAAILSQKLAASFEMGVAGTFIFSWTDEWFTGGHAIQDWAFGVVTENRQNKPAFKAVQHYYQASLPPALTEYPQVSVIVCAYNAERTMESCLASLEKLNYPNYEVIVVNDGSTDRTLEICQKYPHIKLICQPNYGLSIARNVGLEAATGEIIAYTDSDCYADPDWLTYLVITFQSTGLSAVGGPNFQPPEDSLIPSCVAVSPGCPTHVLLGDDTAEHIAGCNMAFLKKALQEINGFDPQFRAAGDDIDVCWRLQDQGYTIGFSPAAIVWHYRRNTVKDYLKQQRGYGKAEALVYFKHPYRFNLFGQARWMGRIYGGLAAAMILQTPVIYSGVFGRGLFQTLYQPSVPMFAYLPLTLEWNLLALLLIGLLAVTGNNPLWGIAPFILSWLMCFIGAWQAPIDTRFQGLRGRLLVALLIYLGPLVRSWERYKWRIKGLGKVDPVLQQTTQQKLQISWLQREIYLSYWTDSGLEKESILQGMMDFLTSRKYFMAVNDGWSDWDLTIYRGLWSRALIRVCAENHGGNQRVLRVKSTFCMSRLTVIVVIGWALATIECFWLKMPLVVITAMGLGIFSAILIITESIAFALTLYSVIEAVAYGLNFVPAPSLKR
ncbi:MULTISPECIES: glycosyltransferase [unclassified Nodularia (in: cyanobacteria)]|uniref:glycosyltransferase n=1 Tax=unclassified Nodularia (in: cyanobacteria) TaxID=2656917 RepID=UPI001881BD0F|nr:MULTISPECIES: glycosyltransferase [unclassified Nodularia (in: cyanobacteria)]MBE9199587.1 glycosyltransferase [Nodularia sp. LEGE 06071]MCC2691400.1 glycosyltransferase [Nodularia sp. LEGE 04288]